MIESADIQKVVRKHRTHIHKGGWKEHYFIIFKCTEVTAEMRNRMNEQLAK